MSAKDLIASTLDEIARYLELDGANSFKVRAFSRAAEAVRDIDEEIDRLIESGEIDRVDGIGPKTAEVVREIAATGESTYLEDLRSRFPAGLLDLEGIPGLGLKKIRILWQQLEISSLEDLDEAIRKGELAALPGLGAGTQKRIAEGLRARKRDAGRILLSKALEIANRIVRDLEGLGSIEKVEISGALRRRLEIAGEIQIVVAAEKAVVAAREIVDLDLPERFEAVGDHRLVGRSIHNLPVEILLVERDRYALTLLISTGTDEFVTAFLGLARDNGLDIALDGMRKRRKRVVAADEADLFEMAGVPWIPPELRENDAEIGRESRAGLVEPADLRGTFHVHTTWSDGRSTLREMLGHAAELGLEYVGISDHSRSAGYARGLSVERVEQQLAEIAAIENDFPSLRIFRGTECDILADGSLDYDEKTLARFDFVVASVHSGFTMTFDEMTERIVRAIQNPFVTFIGHLTGRKLLLREGYRVHYDRIFDEAARHGVMIEINGHPRRLDLDWRLMQQALDAGVRLSIHPDAHARNEYAHLLTGVWAARKGRVPVESIFNTRGVRDVEEALRGRRQRAIECRQAAKS